MLISKKIEVNAWGRNTKYYESKGYKIPKHITTEGKLGVKRGTKIFVDINDLSLNSVEPIKYKCDYCGEIIEISYRQYLNMKKDVINKDACSRCNNLYKLKEINLKKHGVDNVFRLEEIKDKIKETNLEKYGVVCALQNDGIKEKSKNTLLEKYNAENVSKSKYFKDKYKEVMIEKYGVDHYSKTVEYKNKVKETSIERYGVEHFLISDEIQKKCKETNKNNHNGKHHTQTKEFKEKMKEINLSKYGVEYSLQSPFIREKIAKTLYNNNKVPTSNQQIYINNILNGTLNYPFKSINIDIAKVEEKIAIEYNGGGHNLSVKLGHVDEKDFKIKEYRRKYFLQRNFWNRITIISSKDKLPSEDYIIKMYNDSIELLNKGYRWVEFDIDNSTLEVKDYKIKYNFGKIKTFRSH